MEKVMLENVKDGDVFTVAGVEFIKFPDKDGVTPVVAKDVVFRSVFGGDNNFVNSEILKRLETEFLPKIAEAVGAENLLPVKTDLTTLDGLKTYGEMESMVSLPTLDFYRENVEIFDKHKVGVWWWLATADSAKPHYDPVWVTCVSPRGIICYDFYFSDDIGVRPFLNFVSSIFGSCEN